MTASSIDTRDIESMAGAIALNAPAVIRENPPRFPQDYSAVEIAQYRVQAWAAYAALDRSRAEREAETK